MNRGISDNPFRQLNGLHKNSRQSTLDQFVKRAPEPNLKGHINKGKEPGVESEIETSDMGSSVAVDPDTAKTWIYPGFDIIT